MYLNVVDGRTLTTVREPLDPNLISRTQHHGFDSAPGGRMRIHLTRWQYICCNPLSNKFAGDEHLETRCPIVLIEVLDGDVEPTGLSRIAEACPALPAGSGTSDSLAPGGCFPGPNLFYLITL